MASPIGCMISMLWLQLLFASGSVSAFDASISGAPPTRLQQPATTPIHLKLQFDGCFRPPRDPGFPTIPYRMAVCGACIGTVDQEMTVTPLAVGAMEIPVSVETTSQHVEYEGLLMGLEWLVEFISSQIGSEKSIFEKNNSGDAAGEARLLVTIEGDCKTVIDQLTDSSNKDNQVIADVHHIPRDLNPISDSLCNNLMMILSSKSWATNIQELDRAQKQIMEHRMSSFSKIYTTVASPSLSEILESATKTTKNSLRASLYEMVASLALETKDYQLLIKIGEKLIEEESALKMNINFRPEEVGDQGYDGHIPGKTAVSLKRTGIIYQIRGWEGLQNEKKTKFLRRKHRRLLSNEFGNGNKTDIDGLLQSINYQKHNDSTKLTRFMNQAIIELGDVSEGDWNTIIPDAWKPMLDEWFLSARYERVKEVEKDRYSPVWVGVL